MLAVKATFDNLAGLAGGSLGLSGRNGTLGTNQAGEEFFGSGEVGLGRLDKLFEGLELFFGNVCHHKILGIGFTLAGLFILRPANKVKANLGFFI